MPSTNDQSQSTVLPDVGILAIEGSDAAVFLQGYLTSDTRKIDAERLQATALCNLQGRVLANGYATLNETAVWLFLGASTVPLVAEFLHKYLRFAKSRALDLRDAYQVFACATDVPGARSYTDSAALGWAPKSDVPTPRDDAVQHWLCQEIRARRLMIPAALSEQFLPQMLGLDATGAVSFDKGCYLGQEIVARAQHRGELKRVLSSLRWHGACPVIGAALLDEGGTTAGTVVAVGREQADAGVALAVTRRSWEGVLHATDSAGGVGSETQFLPLT
jgi:folate-binding protein YgfZ